MPRRSPPPEQVHSCFLVWDSPDRKWYWICRGCGKVSSKSATYEGAVKRLTAHEAIGQKAVA